MTQDDVIARIATGVIAKIPAEVAAEAISLTKKTSFVRIRSN